MKRQDRTFALAFFPTALVVAGLVYRDQTWWALGAGATGLIAHWALSTDPGRNDEVADASYFFGFLLTLVFLAVGLLELAPAPPETADGGTSAAGSDSANIVLGFMRDLAAGLALSILGLTVRQIRTLGLAPSPDRDKQTRAALTRLAASLETLVRQWEDRPEQREMESLSRSRTAAQDAAQSLGTSVAEASAQMISAARGLEKATVSATEMMTRAASSAGDTISQSAQRLGAELDQLLNGLRRATAETTAGLEAEMGKSLTAIETEVSRALRAIEAQRVEATDGLEAAQSEALRMRETADAQLKEGREQWRATLERTRLALEETHRALDVEYRRGIEGFAASGTAFAALSTTAADQVASLPNPAERLSGLWEGVRELENEFTRAMERSTAAIEGLRGRAGELSEGLQQLGRNVESAATTVDGAGGQLGEALHRELGQMNEIIDEYVTLLENTTTLFRQDA